MYARGQVPQITTDWAKCTVLLTTHSVAPAETTRFVVSTGSPGTLWLTQVSLFAPIKAVYPNLQVIATTGVSSRTPDVIDEHFYETPRSMERDTHHYDNHSRTGPKIFVGEWASQEGRPTNRKCCWPLEAPLSHFAGRIRPTSFRRQKSSRKCTIQNYRTTNPQRFVSDAGQVVFFFGNKI